MRRLTGFIFVTLFLISILLPVNSNAQNFLFSIPSGQPLSDPAFIANDSSGNTFFTLNVASQVIKINSSGVTLMRLGDSIGSGDGQFNRPAGIAIDSSDNLYVADGANNRIQKFDSTGNFLGWLGKCTGGINCSGGISIGFTCTAVTCTGLGSGTNEGQFNFPQGIAIDSSDNIYISDGSNRRIQKFDSTGNFIRMWGYGVDDGTNVFQICTGSCQGGSFGTNDGQFSFPQGIDVDSLGNTYVADPNNNRVQKFDLNGNFIGWAARCSAGANCMGGSSNGFTCTAGTCIFGGSGSGDGQFSGPVDVAIDTADNIYIADRSNERVQKFNSSGNFVGWSGRCTFGVNCDTVNQRSNGLTCTNATCNGPFRGTEDGQFNITNGISFDGTGNIYVSDPGNDNLQKFDSSGSFLARFGISGTGDGQFRNPRDVVVDSSGNIYVADQTNQRIQKFNSSGTFIAWAGYCDSGSNCNVPNFRSNGFSCTAATCSPLGQLGTNIGQYREPAGLDIDTSDNIYVADSSNRRIQKIDTTGNVLMTVGTSGSGDGQFIDASGVALDSSGNIYVPDKFNHRVQKFNSSGTFIGWLGKCTSGADCLASSSSDGFGCTASTCNGLGMGTGEGQFNFPQSIDIDASGNIYIADTNNNRIQMFDSNGNFIRMWGFGVDDGTNVFQICTSSCQAGLFGSGIGQFSRPLDISIDNIGNIYVTDTNNDRIQKFDSSGSIILKFGTRGTGDGQFVTPSGAGFDSSGKFYVADTNNGRVQVFDVSQTCGNMIVEGTEQCDDGAANGTVASCCSDSCTFEPVSTSCDDDDACTTTDTCDGSGMCVSGPALVCDDGEFCNGVESCDSGTGCVVGTPPVIDDGVGCTDDSCDEINDVVVNLVNNANCTNGQFCDGQETCDAINDCQAGIAVNPDDGVGCTVDSCNETTDSIDNIPNNSLCDNGLFCDGSETCDAINDCQAGTAPDPNDGVSCTVDSCNETTDSIDNVATDSLCDNGLFCDGTETCDAVNDCQAGTAPTVDDGVSCTDDSCDETNDVVVNIANNAICDDGAFCNGEETCDAVNDCQAGTAPVVDDGVVCTDDTCDEVNDVVVNTVNDGNCDNGLFCDGSETCHPVNDCQAGTAPEIDDGVACTDDSCDESNDVVVNNPNNTNCDNDLFCDGAEICDATLDCQAGTPPDLDDGVDCTDDSCDEDLDEVVHEVNDSNCDNGLFCDGAETCDAVNDCQAGTAPETDDGVACTDDSCDEEADQVINTANNENCDNGLFCDGEEICDTVNDCQEGNPIDPSDGINCTEDRCDEEADQVVNAPDDSLCDDNEFCTGVESCDVDAGCVVDNNPPDGEMCTALRGPEGMCMNGSCVNEGVITIVKVANPRDGTDFEFGCSDEDTQACEDLGDQNGLFTLDDEPSQADNVDQTITSDLMFIGLYMIEELLPQGWQLDQIECVNDQDGESVLDPDSNMVMVDLDPAEDITCTFFNSSVSDTGEFLSVDADVETLTVEPGEMVTMSVDINNPSSVTSSLALTRQTAEGVIFTVDIPDGFTVQELTTSQGDCDIELLECDLGDIEPGETVTVSVDTVVPEGDGVFRVSFRASTSSGQEFSGTATVNVQGEDTDGGVGSEGSGGAGGCGLAGNSVNASSVANLLILFTLIIVIGFVRLVSRIKRDIN